MSGSSRSRRGLWRRGRRAVVGGLLIVALPTLVIGCGSSGPTTTTSSGSAQNAAQNAAPAAFAYSRCMRSHGVSNFPDPQVITGGDHQGVIFHVKAFVGSPTFKAASRACRSILPAPSGPSPVEQQARKNGLLAFARCMRGKGVGSFPDPNLQGELSLQTISAAGVDIHSRQILDIAKSCVGVSNGAVRLADIEAAESGAH